MIETDGDIVYLIRCADKYNIGYSRNPFKRFLELQANTPFDLSCIATCPGDEHIKNVYSVKFTKSFIRSDWYTLTDEQVSEVIHDFKQLHTHNPRVYYITKELNLPVVSKYDFVLQGKIQYFPHITFITRPYFNQLSDGRIITQLTDTVKIYPSVPPTSYIAYGMNNIPKCLNMWNSEGIPLKQGTKSQGCYCVLPDDRIVIGCGSDIQIFDPSGEFLFAITVVSQFWIRNIYVLPNGNILTIGAMEADGKIWNLDTRLRVGTLHHTDKIVCTVVSNGRIITGSKDTTIKFWSLKDYSLLKTLDDHDSEITALVVKGDYMISGTFKGQIFIWYKDVVQTYLKIQNSIDYIGILPNDTFITDGIHIKWWNIDFKNPLQGFLVGKTLTEDYKGSIKDILILDDGTIGLRFTDFKFGILS